MGVMFPDDAAPDRPVLVLLESPGAPPPYNLAEIETLARVRRATAADLPAALPGADILILWDFFSRALRDNWGPTTQTLRWVHVCAAGVDALLFDDLAESDVVVTNARGVFDVPIAEFVLASILARDKKLADSRRSQAVREWRHRETIRTQHTSALVIGTGGIGRAIARILRAVGIRVTGVGRVAREHDPDFGTVHPSADLAAHVGRFDNIVAAAPLTAQTVGLIDATVLAAMAPHAHLINVGRGRLVDENALVDALRAGRVGQASLDVFATEPLAADSPLWGLDNVAISAHMSGDVVGWRDELADQLIGNLRIYRRTPPGDLPAALHNVVDKRRGYVVQSTP